MESLKESILRSELQREIELARALEKKGENGKAAIHYLKAAGIYRRLARDVPIEKAKEMFNAASQYESLVRSIRHRESVESVRRIDPETREEMIKTLMVTEKPDTTWEDIGGLKEVKTVMKEAIILPFIHDKPPFIKSHRTILLYGPPGTGKTLLAKAACNMLDGTFFDARPSSLFSKYFGESSKIINTLFSKAKEMQPSVIFIDEIDSLAIKRDADMDDSTRRVIAQLLTEIDGFNTTKEDRILIIGATNKPWDLDEAIISRFQKRIYVPLPDKQARERIFQIHLSSAELDGISYEELAEMSEGFSGRDIANLCQEAIIKMVREENPELEQLNVYELERYSLKYRKLVKEDFEEAFKKIRPTVKSYDVKRYERWGQEYGDIPGGDEDEELESLERERDSIRKAKEIAEKEYLDQKIDEETFRKIIQDYEERLIEIEARIKSLKSK